MSIMGYLGRSSCHHQGAYRRSRREERQRQTETLKASWLVLKMEEEVMKLEIQAARRI